MASYARIFEGLTPRRLAFPAILGLVLCLFDWPVAMTYVRGHSASRIATAFLQNWLGTCLSFYAGLLAGVAAWNGVRAGAGLRAAAALGAVAAASLAVFPLHVALRFSWAVFFAESTRLVPMWVSSFGTASLAVAAIVYMARADRAAQKLEAETRRELDLARAHDEARLSAMQAQIEPHFLFNTLANVRRLYGVDRDAARTMLRQFVSMLAQTLPDIRSRRSTLGREVALSLAYLAVQKVRMGDRLTVDTDIPAALHDAALPPMMLSTLVENAIKHGLAPLPQGGRIALRARADADLLRVEVADTGRGLDENLGNGVGLANIETRLAALFGGAAALELEPNDEGGVTARIDLPLMIEPAACHDAA